MADDPTALQLVKQAWFSIRDNYDRLRQAANDPHQLTKLAADRDKARTLYLDTEGKAFDESDAAVKAAKDELKTAADALVADLQALQDIVSILKLVSSVASLIAKVASFAG